jgi:hypothetical protein
MRPRLRITLATTVIVASTALSAGQQAPSGPAPQAGRFTAASAGVLVDVVVRDKKGPVMDLNAEDFTVTEDGKPQEVVSFERRMVADTASSGGTTTVSGATPAKPAARRRRLWRWPRPAVAGRPGPRIKAQAFLKNRRPDELTGVFAADQAPDYDDSHDERAEVDAAIEQAAQAVTTQTGKRAAASRHGWITSPGPPWPAPSRQATRPVGRDRAHGAGRRRTRGEGSAGSRRPSSQP